MLGDADVQFVDRRYGKNAVRLLYVRREGIRHYIKEVEVNTKITLNDTRDFLRGDNSKIVATDSQKNTVYILAKQLGIQTIEKFAIDLSEHFLKQYSHVTNTDVSITEQPWKRIQSGGREHAHAFVETADGVRFCRVEQQRYGQPKVTQGIRALKIMKTTQSAFNNFVNDEYRTLPDSNDRIFCTIVNATWDFHTLSGLNFDTAWETAKASILDIFAGPPDTGVFSPSVQKTLYDSQKLILSKIPQMDKIEIKFPNVHAYEFDLSKFKAFGFTENRQVFQPTAKPAGEIQATLQRKITSRL